MRSEAKTLLILAYLGMAGLAYGLLKPSVEVVTKPEAVQCEETMPEPAPVVPKLVTVVDRPVYVTRLATAMTMYRKNPIKFDEAVEYVEAMVFASAVHGVPVETLIAVAWVETRWKPLLIGDNGRSCGMFQQQTRYSRGALGEREYVGSRKTSDECVLLTDFRYASHVAAGLIKSLKRICQYNQGPDCIVGEKYTHKVRSVEKHFRKIIRDSIDG